MDENIKTTDIQGPRKTLGAGSGYASADIPLSESLRTPAERMPDGGAPPTADESSSFATYRGGNHLPSDILMQKQAMREKMKAIRSRLAVPEMEKAASACLKRLCCLRVFREAPWVYTYIACRGELDTSRMIPEFLKMGKRVAAPKVHGKEMVFYEIRSLGDCQKGTFGILEPETDRPVRGRYRTGRYSHPGVMLAPGLAFDSSGGRLGYGGGYYDRYLEQNEFQGLIGLAYDFQLAEYIPSETHDTKLDYIITPGRTLKNNR